MCWSFVNLFSWQTSKNTGAGYPVLGNTDRALQVPEAVKNHERKVDGTSSSEFFIENNFVKIWYRYFLEIL
jgi:hypothetical protein